MPEQITILTEIPRTLSRLERPQSLLDLTRIATLILTQPETYRQAAPALEDLLEAQAKRLTRASTSNAWRFQEKFTALLAYYAPTMPQVRAALWALAASGPSILASNAMEQLSRLNLSTAEIDRLTAPFWKINTNQEDYTPALVGTALIVCANTIKAASPSTRARMAVLAFHASDDLLSQWLSDPLLLDLYNVPELVPFISSHESSEILSMLNLALPDMPPPLRKKYLQPSRPAAKASL